MTRSATLELAPGKEQRELRVTLPPKTTPAEFAVLTKSIFEIIHGHTGCTCLSGVIPVVIHDQELREIVNVNLGAVAKA